MSILAFVHLKIDLEYSRENIIKILQRGSKLQYKYRQVEDGSREIMATAAADLAIANNDPNWVGAVLSINCPEAIWDFRLLFFPKVDGVTISFSGFDRNPLERVFKYKLQGIDFALYINLLLKFTEPYRVVDIEVGYDY